MKQRLLVVCNDLDFFLLHRLPETMGALQQGYEVHVATPNGERTKEIIALGLIHHGLIISRSGRNPFLELRSFLAIYRLFLSVKPDLVYLMTVKPILYGGIAARIAGVKAVVAAVFGMGYLFTDNGFRTRSIRLLVIWLYRFALDHRNIRVIFQNPSDRDLMTGYAVVKAENTLLIGGSGVDLERFKFRPEPNAVPVVLMAARLLYDKGVIEYIEAVNMLCSQGIKARFLLAGDRDDGNPSSISSKFLETIRSNKCIEHLGFRRDMPELLSEANIVVLPSYREGLPRVLEEAAACGRAIVTTDVPGCRDAIKPGLTGLLVPVKDARALAKAIRKLIEDGDLRRQMGNNGRILAERCYGLDKIVQEHLSVYKELLDTI